VSSFRRFFSYLLIPATSNKERKPFNVMHPVKPLHLTDFMPAEVQKLGGLAAVHVVLSRGEGSKKSQ